MDDTSDPWDISNGTCYFAASKTAKKDYLPCGNVAVGRDWQCCAAGDTCLGNNACYHKAFDLTYLAGCTNPNYDALSCPDKRPYGSQQWTGLHSCEGDSGLWIGCKETQDVPGSKPPAKCICYGTSEVLFDDPIFDKVGLLPASLGGTISWYDGMKPTEPVTETTKSESTSESTSTPTSDSSSASASESSTTSSSGFSSSAAPANTTTPSGSPVVPFNGGSPVVPLSDQPDLSTPGGTGPRLSTAAQAGIGVGAGLGAMLIGCLLYLALVLRQRHKAKNRNTTNGIISNNNPTAQPTLPNIDYSPLHPFSPPAQPQAAHISPSPGSCPTAAASSGFKSELPADEPRSASNTMHTFPYPYLASSASTPSSLVSSPSTGSQHQQQRRYTAYNPTLHGNYAEKRESERAPLGPGPEVPVSPLTPGEQGEGNLAGAAMMPSPIREMEG